jgi:hypothetical protein
MALRQPLDFESREKLAELVKAMPEREVRRLVGDIASETLARALGGLPVQRGSAELIRSGIARHSEKAA